MKFLIVDDDVISRMTIATLLRQYGEVQEASSSYEAMQVIIATPDPHNVFTAIFLDVRMPEIDGLECLREIRKFEKDQGIDPSNGFKIIMATGDDAELTIMTSFTEQCDGFITKPVQVEKLIKAFKMANIEV